MDEGVELRKGRWRKLLLETVELRLKLDGKGRSGEGR